ncbi:ABC transporter permease subunit [Jatrophihabitans sp. DSM 45814]
MLSDLLPFILVGLTAGAVYGMTATGLVLTFKTSGIFNFAQGALATVATYVFYSLHTQEGMPWPWAMLLSVGVLGTLMGLGMELIARRLAGMSTTMKIVGTLGIILIVQGGTAIIYGDSLRQVDPYLPQDTFTIGSLAVGYDQLIIIIVSLLATGALYVFFRTARMGTAMRAVVDNPGLLASQGVNPTVVRRYSWIVGTIFASLSGVLLVPSIGLSSLALTLLIVQAFGAASIGYFSNLPLTYLGGLVVGVLASIATKYAGQGFWAGLPPAVPFLVLFVVLIVVPRARLTAHQSSVPRPQPQWRAPLRLQVIGGSVLLVLMLIVPMIVGTKLTFYTTALTEVILFLSLGLLVRSSGQVSLAHMGFAAIGAAAFSHFAVHYHMPWLVALLLAGVIAIPVGAIIAIPAIRLNTLYLALATLGFGILLEQMFYTSKFMFGPDSNGLRSPRPHLSWLSVDSDKGFYYVVLVITLICAVFAVWLDHARFGRLLRGLADSPIALSTMGTNINLTKLLVFCVSAFLAGISGALTASTGTSVSGSTFPSFNSFTLVALLALTAGRVPWYAFGAAISLYVVPSFFTSFDITNYLTVLFGIGAVQTALLLETQGRVPAGFLRFIDRIGGRKPAPATAGGPPASKAAVSTQRAARVELKQRGTVQPSDGLHVDRLTVRFGGALAVNDFSLSAPSGAITGLIGPNGAGKTTTFNACSGLLHPSTGTVTLHGRNVSKLAPAARARLGLGRTFQRMELFNSLTVQQNVALGVEASQAGTRPLKQVVSNPSERKLAEERPRDAMELCGIAHLASVQVGLLSTGDRRLVELARCLAGPYDMILLDEPSSGLDNQETQQFGAVLAQVVAQRGTGILLVEHDMSLVMSMCQYIYVLDFGNLIFEGTPAEVAASPLVKEAYLGAVELENDLDPTSDAVPLA